MLVRTVAAGRAGLSLEGREDSNISPRSPRGRSWGVLTVRHAEPRVGQDGLEAVVQLHLALVGLTPPKILKPIVEKQEKKNKKVASRGKRGTVICSHLYSTKLEELL